MVGLAVDRIVYLAMMSPSGGLSTGNTLSTKSQSLQYYCECLSIPDTHAG